MNVPNMVAKIFRELTSRRFTIVQVGDILILLTVMYLRQIAADRQALQLEGADKFAEEVKNQLRGINLEMGTIQ